MIVALPVSLLFSCYLPHSPFFPFNDLIIEFHSSFKLFSLIVHHLFKTSFPLNRTLKKCKKHEAELIGHMVLVPHLSLGMLLRLLPMFSHKDSSTGDGCHDDRHENCHENCHDAIELLRDHVPSNCAFQERGEARNSTSRYPDEMKIGNMRI